MTTLFLDQNLKPKFTKIASPVKLSDNPDQWQMEMGSELYKQLPFLSEYAVNVIIEKMSPERGYAFGSAEVTNKSESPVDHQPKKFVRVPLIVKDRLMMPPDVMMVEGRTYPCNESRLREQLMRTDAFEITNRKPSDQGMVDQLYPPLRTNYGYGNAVATGVGMGGFGKQASTTLIPHYGKPIPKGAPGFESGRDYSDFGTPPKGKEKAWKRDIERQWQADDFECATMSGGKHHAPGFPGHPRTKTASLLEQIAPTIDIKQVDAFITKISGDPELALMIERNAEFKKLAFEIVGAERTSIEKRASTMVDHIRPTVVQLTKLANGNVRMRWANRNAFLVKEGEVAPEQANEMIGQGGPKMETAPEGTTLTVSTEKAKKESLIEEVFEKVEHYGEYKVHAEDGSELEGFVMPIMDFQMQPLELYLWSDGKGQYAVQDEIAGAKMDHEPENIPQAEPEGDGCFYFHEPAGARALLPMTVRNTQTDEEGSNSIVGEDLFGEPVTLTLVDGIEHIEEHAPGSYMIPKGCMWLPLQTPIHLVKSPEELEEHAEGENMPNQAEIKGTGADEVSVDGPPLAKVANKDKRFLKHAEAEFLLVACGANPFLVREKLAQAHKGYTVKIGGLRPILPLADLHRDMVKKAADPLGDFPYQLRRDLIKEAAALEGAETVDSILSLNFINPENIAKFADHLPGFEATAMKLAELLMAARLGLSQVNEGACERSMKNLEQVIQGLKELDHKVIDQQSAPQAGQE